MKNPQTIVTLRSTHTLPMNCLNTHQFSQWMGLTPPYSPDKGSTCTFVHCTHIFPSTRFLDCFNTYIFPHLKMLNITPILQGVTPTIFPTKGFKTHNFHSFSCCCIFVWSSLPNRLNRKSSEPINRKPTLDLTNRKEEKSSNHTLYWVCPAPIGIFCPAWSPRAAKVPAKKNKKTKRIWWEEKMNVSSCACVHVWLF